MPETDHTRGECKPTICTLRGIEFELLNPQPHMIDWQDMAVALAKCVRYTGHCRGSYSVARHSVIMAQQLIAQGKGDYALEALVHDAAEAYLGDCATPLKQLLPRFKEIELGILRQVYLKLGLPVGGEDPVSDVVHDADWQLFLAEWHALMPAVKWVDYPQPRAEWRSAQPDVLIFCDAGWNEDRKDWLDMLYDLMPLEMVQRAKYATS